MIACMTLKLMHLLKRIRDKYVKEEYLKHVRAKYLNYMIYV